MKVRSRYTIQRRPPPPAPQVVVYLGGLALVVPTATPRECPCLDVEREIWCVLCRSRHVAHVGADGFITRCRPCPTSIPGGGDRRSG